MIVMLGFVFRSKLCDSCLFPFFSFSFFWFFVFFTRGKIGKSDIATKNKSEKQSTKKEYPDNFLLRDHNKTLKTPERNNKELDSNQQKNTHFCVHTPPTVRREKPAHEPVD